MSTSFLPHEMQEKVHIACILQMLTPYQDLFTDQLALYCAGMEWDAISTLLYQYPNSALHNELKRNKSNLTISFPHIGQMYNTERKDVVHRYQVFVQLADKWPKNLAPFDPTRSSPIDCANERSSAIRIVGGSAGEKDWSQCPTVKMAMFR